MVHAGSIHFRLKLIALGSLAVLAALVVVTSGNNQYLRTQVALPPAGSNFSAPEVFMYPAAIDQAEVAREILGLPANELMSWPGKLGRYTGTYFARASRAEGTIAPEGDRVFLTKIANGGMARVNLPAPPYSDAVNTFIDNLQLK